MFDGDPYEAVELDDGTVLQSAIHTGSADDSSAAGYITKAVVLAVYFPDDPSWARRGWAATRMRGLACDVRTYGRAGGSHKLPRVPVAQGMGALFDEDVYVPRAATQHIDGGPLVAGGNPNSKVKPTAPEFMDGDHVLVGFLQNDFGRPLIFPFALPHPSAKTKLSLIDGRVRRIRHNGITLEWDDLSNFSIDASGAASDLLGAKATELPAAGVGGKVTIRTADPTKLPMFLELDALTGNVTLQGAGGTEKLTLTKATSAELAAGASKVTLNPVTGAATLAAVGKVTLDGSEVSLGANAQEAVIKGDTFQQALVTVLKAIAAATVPATTPAVTAFEATISSWLSLVTKTE